MKTKQSKSQASRILPLLVFSLCVLLALSLPCQNASAVTVEWDAVTTNADSTLMSDLAGYRVFFATKSFQVGSTFISTSQAMGDALINKRVIPDTETSYTLALVSGNSYYFRVTAFDQSGNQSLFNLDTQRNDVEISSHVTQSAPALGPGNSTSRVSLVLDPSTLGEAILSVKSNDPAFTGASLSISLDLPSGSKVFTLVQHSQDPSTYYTKVASSAFTPEDFILLGGRSTTITVGLQIVQGFGERGAINPVLGGRIVNHLGNVEVVIQPGAVNQDVLLSISSEPYRLSQKMRDSLARHNLLPLGECQDITMTPSGANLQGATLKLPFHRSLIPPEFNTRPIRIAHYDPSTDRWDVVEEANIHGDRVEAVVTHFSIYMPVLVVPQTTPQLKEIYVYPNPAVDPAHPIIHVKMGLVEEAQLTIFDISGSRVHSDSLSGASATIQNGEYCYEYHWSSPKASGIYFAVVNGKSPVNPITAKIKFAVVR